MSTSTSSQRLDPKRQLNQIRPIEVEFAPLQRANGSCRWQQGQSHVLVAVYAPHVLNRANRENPTEATIDVVWRARSTLAVPRGGAAAGSSSNAAAQELGSRFVLQGEAENGGMHPFWLDSPQQRQYEHVLQDALESFIVKEEYPRLGISVIIQILEADGSLLSCAWNACICALMVAGISLRSTPVSITIGTFDAATLGQGNTGKFVLLDPNAREEEQLCNACAHFVVDLNKPSDKQCVSSFMYSSSGGSMSDDEYWSSLRAAKASAKSLLAFIRAAAVRRMQSVLAAPSS